MSKALEWHDISEAPKDGTWLILANSKNADCFLAGFWSEDGYQGSAGWETLDGVYHPDWPDKWFLLPVETLFAKEEQS